MKSVVCAFRDKKMQINPDTKQILGLSEPLYQKAAGSPKKIDPLAADSVESGLAHYLEKAQEIAAEESIDLEHIRKELESGLYDRPEMIRAAAQHIVQFGI